MIWATGWVEPASRLATPSRMPTLAAATTSAGRSSYCVCAMKRARSSVVPIFAPRTDDGCSKRADGLRQHALLLDDDQLVTTNRQRGAELLRSGDQLVHPVALVGDGPEQRLVGLVVADWHTRHLDDLLVLHGDPGQQAQPVDRLGGAVPAAVSLVERGAAKTVEDRLALVDLDGRDVVDAVSHNDVGASIDRRMGDLLLVLQHLIPQAPVVRRNQDVDLQPERCELLDVFV